MSESQKQPLIPAHVKLPELTLKAIILSIVIAAILAAADAYLALRIATTIAASIPAAVIAMGILSAFKNSNVLEINMVQTAASAGEGVSAAIAFILPAMIINHAWLNFPYWQTVFVTLLGGSLGVLFSIPLRRTMLNLPSLRFPEGTAIGNVMLASASKGEALKLLTQGISMGGIVGFLQGGLKIISDVLPLWLVSGKVIGGLAISFEPALFASGYIVGIRTGASLFVGVIIGSIIILPGLAWHYGLPNFPEHTAQVMELWGQHTRFIGVGVLLIGGLWTLIQLVKPVFEGLSFAAKSTFNRQKTNGEEILRTEYDIPFGYMLAGTLFISILIIFFLYHLFLHATLPHIAFNLPNLFFYLILLTIFILIIGFTLSAICGHIAGLIGTSNSPLSGLLIISILLLGAAFLLIFNVATPAIAIKLTSLMILIIAIVGCTAAISIENIQDFKAGQIVGATPWKQQLIILLGVLVSALVIAPVLQILFDAYGIGGVFPHPNMDPSQMLAAPQAGLISTITQGVLTHHLNWVMLGIGAFIAILCIFVDEFLKTKNMRLVVLAVGLGIYLPAEICTSIFLGSLVHYLAERWRKQRSMPTAEIQSSTLLACGLVAGSALMGVILAVPFVLLGSSDALAIVSNDFAPIANVLGVLSLLGLGLWLFYTAIRKG